MESRELMASMLLTDGVCIDVSPPSGSAGNANAGWGSSDERAPISAALMMRESYLPYRAVVRIRNIAGRVPGTTGN